MKKLPRLLLLLVVRGSRSGTLGALPRSRRFLLLLFVLVRVVSVVHDLLIRLLQELVLLLYAACAFRLGSLIEHDLVAVDEVLLLGIGDIQLIPDPRVRAAIIEYASILKGSIADIDGQPDRMRRANDSEFLRYEEAGLPPRMDEVSDIGKYEGEQLEDYRMLYIAAWPALRKDPQYRNVQNLRILAYDNMTSYHKEILIASDKLIAILEADEKTNAP